MRDDVATGIKKILQHGSALLGSLDDLKKPAASSVPAPAPAAEVVPNDDQLLGACKALGQTYLIAFMTEHKITDLNQFTLRHRSLIWEAASKASQCAAQ